MTAEDAAHLTDEHKFLEGNSVEGLLHAPNGELSMSLSDLPCLKSSHSRVSAMSA